MPAPCRALPQQWVRAVALLHTSTRSSLLPIVLRPDSGLAGLRACIRPDVYNRIGAWNRGHRALHIPAILLPPVAFTGLLIALWAWKCLMMVVWQNKIIYMPSLPPNARWETIADHAARCGGIKWHEKRTRAADGTDLAMAIADVSLPLSASSEDKGEDAPPPRHARHHIYILYFQGNASSLPPRLPDISWVVHAMGQGQLYGDLPPMQLTFVGLSYRGYWTSKGRAREKGLRLDAEAGVEWIVEQHRQVYGQDAEQVTPILMVWGQSIGSGVATNLAASENLPPGLPIQGLLLETPFLNVRAMLETLYPQKWLPYRHLWPFLRNHLDSWANFGTVAERAKRDGAHLPGVFILEAARDELVPPAHGEQLYQRCIELGYEVKRMAAPVAYHSEAIARGAGKRLAAEGLLGLTRQAIARQKRAQG